MLTLGLLSIENNQEQEYFTQIAKRAMRHKIKVVRFRPTDVRPNTPFVNGLIYDSTLKEWMHDSFQLPKFLYDRCFYNSEQSLRGKPIVDWLKKRHDITFLGHGLPNKLILTDTLFEQDILRPFIPTTHKLIHTKQVLQMLQRERKLVLKPISGSRGIDIYFLSLNGKKINIQTQKGKSIISESMNGQHCTHFIQKLMSHQEYMIQSYLPLHDEDNAPFDIRIFLQKNQHGHWERKAIGIRRGTPNTLISNLSGGGKVEQYEDWKRQFIGGKKVDRLISKIIKHLPTYLESRLVPLFEVGLDIGVDQNSNIWILDVNSKPGHQVALQTNPEIREDIFTAPLLYCRFLDEKGVTYIG